MDIQLGARGRSHLHPSAHHIAFRGPAAFHGASCFLGGACGLSFQSRFTRALHPP